MLNIVSYEIKRDHYYQGSRGEDDELRRKNQVGVIAQEIEEVMPELVQEDEDSGLKSVGYLGLIPPLVAAVQELNRKQEEIDLLRAELEKMKEQVEKQESKINLILSKID